MQTTIDPKFEKLIGQRLKFKASFKEAKKLGRKSKSANWRITLRDVSEFSTKDQFRDHVNIFLTTGDYNNYFKKAKFGDQFEFTAEIHRYTKLPRFNKKNGLYYQTYSIGLTKVKKIKKQNKKE